MKTKSTYTIKNVEVTLNETNLPLVSDMITGLELIDDYFKRKCTIMRLNMIMDTETIRQILSFTKGKPLLKLEIYENVIDFQNESLISSDLFIRGTYTIIPVKEASEYRLQESPVGVATSERLDQFQDFDVYLIDMNHEHYFSKQHSPIFKNISRPDALKAIFKMKDIPPGVVIATPPNDTGMVDTITIPQGGLVDNVMYLNEYYGLYTSQCLVYRDLFNFYCLNMTNPNIVTSKPRDYNITFSIPEDMSADMNKPWTEVDDSKKLITLSIPTQPMIRDMANMVHSVQYGTIMSVDKDGNVKKITLSEGSNKLKYVYSKSDMSIDQAINTDISATKIVDISLTDTPLRHLLPYKTCTFNVPRSVAGIYQIATDKFMITAMVSIFVRNGNVFNVNTTMSLTSVNKQQSAGV